MKPFNLERAIAGDPVQTKNGKPVSQLTAFNCIDKYNVIGVVDGEIDSWDEWGNSLLLVEPENYQLVMSSVKKTGWVNICWVRYEGNESYTNYMGSTIFTSLESALANKPQNWVAAVKIEWEE